MIRTDRRSPCKVSLASLLKTQEHKEQYKPAPTHPQPPLLGFAGTNPAAAAAGHRAGPHVTTGQGTWGGKATSPCAFHLLGGLTYRRPTNNHERNGEEEPLVGELSRGLRDPCGHQGPCPLEPGKGERSLFCQGRGEGGTGSGRLRMPADPRDLCSCFSGGPLPPQVLWSLWLC